MARIIGSICTSHVPLIGKAIANGLQHQPYWQPFFDGFDAVHEWLERNKPDLAVVFYNDHGLNFFLDKLPTFAIGAGPEFRNADEGWGLPIFNPFYADPEFSWHVIESLVAAEFDITTCQDMLVDHAFTIPMALLWPGVAAWPVKTLPISINTIQHPLPKPSRCLALGQAVGRAIASYPEDLKVVVIGTGGLSHQLDGTRAGFINKAFDRLCMEKLEREPEEIARRPIMELIELAGAQGVEIIMWLAARGALGSCAHTFHSNYHVPISNTAAGLLLMEPLLSEAIAVPESVLGYSRP